MIKKVINKPVNWQDFETLCKKLWGEIWKCQNIKKNGRSGQPQNGVDIYGKLDDGWYGIQCKYCETIAENVIEEEIEKAKEFKPALKSYIIATTAEKNAKIEEFVRIKNDENTKNGDFSIDLFCWEDIVDLIESNPKTNKWYNDYKTETVMDVITAKDYESFIKKKDEIIQIIESNTYTEILNLERGNENSYYSFAKFVVVKVEDFQGLIEKIKELNVCIGTLLPVDGKKYFNSHCTWHFDSAEWSLNNIIKFYNENIYDFQVERASSYQKYEALCNLFHNFTTHLRYYRESFMEIIPQLKEKFVE